MKRYEYKVHFVKFDCKLGEREDRLLAEINEQGNAGWKLNRIYPAKMRKSLGIWGGGLNLLLEREVITDPT